MKYFFNKLVEVDEELINELKERSKYLQEELKKALIAELDSLFLAEEKIIERILSNTFIDSTETKYYISEKEYALLKVYKRIEEATIK